MKLRRFLIVATGLLVAACSADDHGCGRPGCTDDDAALSASAIQDDAALQRIGDAYYLAGCAACGGALGARGETIDIVLHRRDLRFCCSDCRDAFLRRPEQSLARLDEVMLRDQMPFYPPIGSLVSGRPLGPDAIDFIIGNRLVRVADDEERRRIMQSPERYISRLDDEVIRAQRPSYGMKTKCPVQGDILPGDPIIDVVVANRMIRVCCGRCVRVVRSRPSQYLGMVEYANRQAAEQPKE